MSTTDQMETSNFDEGWEVVREGIVKLENILDEKPAIGLRTNDFVNISTKVYEMCNKNLSNDNSQKLYDKYRESIEDYLNYIVLPSLRDKDGEFMLKEFVKRWLNHRIMIKMLFRFFHYLEIYFIPKHNLPKLKAVGLQCFIDMMNREIYGKVSEAVKTLLDEESEGMEIDKALLNKVGNIFARIERGSLKLKSESESESGSSS